MNRKLLVFGLLFILGGCTMYGPNGEVYTVHHDADGWYAETTFADATEEVVILQALVKGSIYETGETVSVFGTCLDGDDNPVSTSNATLSSWYPNGTVHLSNQSMTTIQDGYFLWTGPMAAVQGTYLTELTCTDSATGAVARAFGEWQNPYWVHKIDVINQSLSNLTVDVNNSDVLAAIANLSQNITITIGNLEVDMNESFEITWDKIESVNQTINITYTNLSQQIWYVGQIANNSVDRNDSYIVELLLNLTGIVTPSNLSGTVLNHTEDYDPPVFWSDWDIIVHAYYEGDLVEPPLSTCYIQTSLTPENTTMTQIAGYHYYEEFINRLRPFNWNVTCIYT
jgi:hypothetical protein